MGAGEKNNGGYGNPPSVSEKSLKREPLPAMFSFFAQKIAETEKEKE